jgi:hypothetical protein
MLATLLTALGAGDLDAAAAAVPDGALSALPGAGVETDARVIARERSGLRAALESAFGGRRLEILSLVSATDARLLVEGRLLGSDDTAVQTVLASFRLDHGEIARQLVFTSPLVEPSRSWGSEAASDFRPGDARAAVDTYFEHLDASEFEAAADCFSENVLYSHPPYGPGQPRAEFRGRDELLAGLRRRGPKPDREHHIEASPQRGADCFLEGFTVDEPRGGSFISSLSLDADGRIARYLAVYCEPVVPDR